MFVLVIGWRRAARYGTFALQTSSITIAATIRVAVAPSAANYFATATGRTPQSGRSQSSRSIRTRHEIWI